jgi:hypothetical protein
LQFRLQNKLGVSAGHRIGIDPIGPVDDRWK